MTLAFMSVLEIVSNLYGNLPWGNLLLPLLVCLTLKPPVGKTVWTSPEFWNVLNELEKRVASSLPQTIAPTYEPWPAETGSASLLSVSLPCRLCICISNSRYIPDVIIPTFHCILKILFMQSPNVLWPTIISCSCENPQSCSLFFCFPHFMYPVC